jgi:hypothetical protein
MATGYPKEKTIAANVRAQKSATSTRNATPDSLNRIFKMLT